MLLLDLSVTSIVASVCVLGTIAGLTWAHVERRRRTQDGPAERAALRERLICHISSQSEDSFAEAKLDGPSFLNVALGLLIHIEGVSRSRLLELLQRRNAETRMRRTLRRSNTADRIAVAAGLRFFPSLENRAALLRALRDREVDVRLAAAESLVAQTAPPPLERILRATTAAQRSRPARIQALLRECGERHPAVVAAAARMPTLPPAVRATVIAVLAATADGRHTSTIQSLAADRDPDVRAAVLRGLAKLPEVKSADAIAQCLRDENWFVRATAADTAGRLGRSELAPLIAPLLDDEQWWVRFRASEALERLDAAGRSALNRMAKHGSERQKRQAALTLSKRIVA